MLIGGLKSAGKPAYSVISRSRAKGRAEQHQEDGCSSRNYVDGLEGGSSSAKAAAFEAPSCEEHCAKPKPQVATLAGRPTAQVYGKGGASRLSIMDNLETRLALSNDPALLQLLKAKTPRFVPVGGVMHVQCPACQHTERACAKVYVHECRGRTWIKNIRTGTGSGTGTGKKGFAVFSTSAEEDAFRGAMWEHSGATRNMCPFCSKAVALANRAYHWCGSMDRVVWDLAGMLTWQRGILQHGTTPIQDDDPLFEGYCGVVDTARLRSSLVIYMSQLPGEDTHTVGYALAAPSRMRPGDKPMRGLYPVCGEVERWLYVGQLETDAQKRANDRAEQAFKKQRLDGRARLAPLASMFDLARTPAGKHWVNPLTYGNLAVLLNNRCEPDRDAAQRYNGGPWAMVQQGPSMRYSTQRAMVGGTQLDVAVLQPADKPWPRGTEMTWFYDASATKKSEAVPCLCGAPFCSRHLVAYRPGRKRER